MRDYHVFLIAQWIELYSAAYSGKRCTSFGFDSCCNFDSFRCDGFDSDSCDLGLTIGFIKTVEENKM